MNLFGVDAKGLTGYRGLGWVVLCLMLSPALISASRWQGLSTLDLVSSKWLLTR